MLTQLSTVKGRLNIAAEDTQYDALLTRFIEAVGVLFEHQCQRALGRMAGATQEFSADCTEIRVACYPIEGVSLFELKANEIEGWVEQDPPKYLVREACVISLPQPLGNALEQSRITYTGGYVLPGQVVGAGQTPLPADLENAAVEQVAAWFQNRDKLGLLRNWPSGGVFQAFMDLPLLPLVELTLKPYQRWVL